MLTLVILNSKGGLIECKLLPCGCSWDGLGEAVSKRGTGLGLDTGWMTDTRATKCVPALPVSSSSFCKDSSIN